MISVSLYLYLYLYLFLTVFLCSETYFIWFNVATLAAFWWLLAWWFFPISLLLTHLCIYSECRFHVDSMVCCLVTQSCLTLFVIQWTVGHQAPLSMGFFQERIPERVDIFFSRGSSWLRDWTCISCIRTWTLYYWATRKAPAPCTYMSFNFNI